MMTLEGRTRRSLRIPEPQDTSKGREDSGDVLKLFKKVSVRRRLPIDLQSTIT